ncbi:hypothetical protein PBCV1_a195R [Paramecium bursaria Chlorella virus 1]|uniref:Uncharacterized protein n=1 Tax=Paramecium bursaria Chlorella virus 1 TaxID=10506 RepID=Q84515_PBCV1|nr:hypothetical protein PBCV1_a195R [Paramecium bursaria Chlorella virus 1]AAC96563.1 hypothetical protein [Paramecium bursaria Chlorella virus 1]
MEQNVIVVHFLKYKQQSFLSYSINEFKPIFLYQSENVESFKTFKGIQYGEKHDPRNQKQPTTRYISSVDTTTFGINCITHET